MNIKSRHSSRLNLHKRLVLRKRSATQSKATQSKVLAGGKFYICDPNIRLLTRAFLLGGIAYLIFRNQHKIEEAQAVYENLRYVLSFLPESTFQNVWNKMISTIVSTTDVKTLSAIIVISTWASFNSFMAVWRPYAQVEYAVCAVVTQSVNVLMLPVSAIQTIRSFLKNKDEIIA